MQCKNSGLPWHKSTKDQIFLVFYSDVYSSKQFILFIKKIEASQTRKFQWEQNVYLRDASSQSLLISYQKTHYFIEVYCTKYV